MEKEEKKPLSIFDVLSKDATKILGYGMLEKLIEDSKEVIGGFDKVLQDPRVSTADKLTKIQQLEQIALSEVVKSFNPQTKDEDKLIASSRLVNIANQLKNTIKQKHSIEVQEVIDFTHPKVSLAFGFLLELLVKTLTEHNIDEDIVLKMVDALSTQTINFEEKLNEVLHNLPLAQIHRVQNPFIDLNPEQEIDYVDLYEKPKKQLTRKMVDALTRKF